jgi:hypothetical protein
LLLRDRGAAAERGSFGKPDYGNGCPANRQMPGEDGAGAFLVLLAETAVADDVGDQNGCEAAFHFPKVPS